MQNATEMKKDDIRKELLRRLRDQDPSLREERSRKIQEKLLSSEEFQVSKTVMTYVSLPQEVNTEEINKKAQEQGKRMVVPYIGPNSRDITAVEFTSIENLEKGPFGIYQPAAATVKEMPLAEIDLIVIPAIAYDKNNMRLGRGKGFYDRFLSLEDLYSKPTIGLAFNFQVIDYIPSDPHDVPVSRVLTD